MKLKGKPQQAEFFQRTRCISCESDRLEVLDSGYFGDGLHRKMIESAPWGESPLPYLEACQWVLVRCRECSQVFHRNVLTPEWEERRFTEWMTEEAIQEFEERRGVKRPSVVFDRGRSLVERLLTLEKMTREIRGEEALRFFDFGCGWGRLVAFASLFGMDAHGVDRSTARRNLTFVQGKIHESLVALHRAEPRAFHAASMLQVLEHLEKPRELLKAIHERLLPGAILLLEVPDASGVEQLRNENDWVVSGLDHINAFSPQTLEGMTRRVGFEPVSAATVHVTADAHKVLKREVRRLTSPITPKTTHQYFRRV